MMATLDEYIAAIRAMTADRDNPASEEDLAALATVTAEYLKGRETRHDRR